MALEVEAELDAIYVLPPGQFTSARNQLEKRLKAAGDKAEAARVKALGKPKLTAWLVNLLALRHPTALDELRALGAALASAQRSGSAAELNQASAARKAQVKTLLELCQTACAEHGEKLGAAAERELTTSLETLASLTADGAERPGRMTQPLAAAGFGAFGVLGLAPLEPHAVTPPTPKPSVKTPTRAAPTAEPRVESQASAEQAAAEARLKARREREVLRGQLNEQLTQAEARLDELNAQQALARSTLDNAENRRTEMQAALATNQARLTEAEAELARVKSELARSQRDLERAQQSVQGHTKGLRHIVEKQAPAQELVGKLKHALQALDTESDAH